MKNYIFRDELWQLSIKICLVLRVGTIGRWIRIWDHSWTYFDITNPMIILELPNKLQLKNTIFEVSTIAPLCVSFCFLCFQGYVLEIEHIHELVLTRRTQIELQSLFWLMSEKFTFWTILPLDLKLWIWSSGAAMNAREHGWARIRGRNSNTQLVMDFNNVLIVFWIYGKKSDLKIWFL